MSDPPGGRKLLRGWKRRRSPSPPAAPRLAPGTHDRRAIPSLASHSLQTMSTWVPQSTSPSNTPSNSNSIRASTSAQANDRPHVPASPPQAAASTSSMHSRNIEPRDNPYMAIDGLPPDVDVPERGAPGSVIYEGLKTILQGLYDCSDMFLPLKTAAGGLLTVIKIVDTVSGNKKELEDLKVKLETIMSIVKNYQKHGGLRALDHRIEVFCQAIVFQLKAVEELQGHSLITRTFNGAKDADTILKAFRNISGLCDVFQMDTQLNMEGKIEDMNDTVKVILQRLNSGAINKLNHEMTSYKTRHSSYGDPTGCMQGTRVKILEDLEAWASDVNAEKVYWMLGMAGTGKSTISHTLCKMLEGKNMLGGNFFGSRASDKTNNARLIIPIIAHALASTSPSIKSAVIKAIEDDPTLTEPTYINLDEQFQKLIYKPIQMTTGKVAMIFKVIVIDALDECTNLEVVASLIKLILQSASNLPLKFFIASRDERRIRNAFYHFPTLSTTFKLHEVEKSLVEEDIRKYIEKSLIDIKNSDSDHTLDDWPTPSELSKLTKHSGRLFIYAATAIRYIRDGDNYQDRLSWMADQDSITEASIIDNLYTHILNQACAARGTREIGSMRTLVSIIVFLRNPLSIDAIISLSQIKNPHLYLSPLSSVIYIPDHMQEHAAIAPFHASFPDFITDPKRCSTDKHPSFPALIPSEGHRLLALRCLERMNHMLKYNICGLPKESTVSRREATNPPYDIAKIPEALKYSCVYWASHLAEAEKATPEVLDALREFLHKHLLHWIECLSIVGELQTGIKSLQSITTVLADFGTTDTQSHRLRLLVDDGRRCLQRNFECIQQHWFEIYWSALVWMPKTSLIRDVYAGDVRRVPQVVLGLSKTWGQTELIIQHSMSALSVAFSQDGSRVVSGSHDNTVRIWNTTTGEVEAELKGHRNSVTSVAFSQDGSRVVSGSSDKTVRIWSTTTGEVEAELKGHRNSVTSVAFSQDGSRVVSGSDDKTVRIWSTRTGEVEAELKGHRNSVTSVAFSQDGSRVVSGSDDNTVRIWSTTTGEVEAELKGHRKSVTSVAFSQDGSRVVSGSSDKTVRIRSTRTGEVEAELKGHRKSVTSVAFSQDGSRVVSGSDDKTVRIWSTTTGEVEAELKGHRYWVRSVAFSQDGSRVVSGSDDKTVRIWSTTTGEVEAELKGHRYWVRSVAFSQDGSRVVSGSDDKTVRIWSTTTGEVEAELKGHRYWVRSVAFSQDGSRVVSGSDDKTVRIWSTTTGEVEAELKGHRKLVTSVAFSQDGSRVVSGSSDKTVRIWSTRTGEVEAELKGHRNLVTSVAFSQDGSRVVSGSDDKTVRIWSTTTGEVEAELKGHRNSVTSVAFSQDGSRVVSGSSDKTVRIWSTTTGEVEAEKSHMYWMKSLAFSQDGSHVIFHDSSNKVRTWDMQTANPQVHSELHSPLLSLQPPLLLSDDNWIVGELYDCWIPSHERGFVSSSFSRQGACFGYQSGRVVILDMTVTP